MSPAPLSVFPPAIPRGRFDREDDETTTHHHHHAAAAAAALPVPVLAQGDGPVYEEAYMGGKGDDDDDSDGDGDEYNHDGNATRTMTKFHKPSAAAITSFSFILMVLANVVAFAALSWQQQELRQLQQQPKLSPSSLLTPESSVRGLEKSNQYLRSQQDQQQQRSLQSLQQQSTHENNDDMDHYYSLQGLQVLVAIAAFDFSQLPHLEEVLDGYHDLCVAGAAKVRIVIHTTVAWPVALLDLLQTRFSCPNFSLDIVLKLQRVRLHLVDYHRKLFYDHLDEYDVFIYTEDDIRITPTTGKGIIPSRTAEYHCCSRHNSGE